ncbi:MAG TPA: ATP-binding protein [Actinoplanes sp.]|nr:ATP-binding protein [Actinoplanes sp.]
MERIRVASPPPTARPLHQWTLTSTTELRVLRAALQDALVLVSHDPDEVIDRIVLVATELATNAIRHGLPPTEIRLLEDGDQIILDVADHDLTSIPEPAGERPLGEGGRGLLLARAFSLDVGWYATPGTKHIWASFPLER